MHVFSHLVRTMERYLSVLVALGISISSLTPAFADQHGAQTEETHHHCRDYELFLGLLSAEDLTRECSEIETFVLSSQSLEPHDFLQAYSDAMSRTSVIGTLANALAAQMDGETHQAYVLFDAADRAFYSAMEGRGDSERAVVYAIFLSAAKAAMVRNFCEGGTGVENCAEIEGFTTVEEVFGSDSIRLDRHDPLAVLFCLMRTDAFTTPVIDVLSSRQFLRCLVRQEYF